MRHWNLTDVGNQGDDPEILASTDEGRAVLIHLAAGESLQDHRVHERAWVMVVAGEIGIGATAEGDGDWIDAGTGSLFSFDPGERHEVKAASDATILLLLTPWPGEGHPGAMSLEEKASARERAAEHQG